MVKAVSKLAVHLLAGLAVASCLLALPRALADVVQISGAAGVLLQASTPGTQQIGHFNVSGTGLTGRLQTGNYNVDQNAASMISVNCTSNTDCTLGITPSGNSTVTLGYYQTTQGNPGYPGTYLKLGGVAPSQAAKVMFANGPNWSIGHLNDYVFRGRQEFYGTDWLQVGNTASVPVTFPGTGGVAVSGGPLTTSFGATSSPPSPPSISVGVIGIASTFTAGTYYYRATCVYPSGETAPSTEVSQTILANQSIQITVTASGAVAPSTCRIYGRTLGAEQFITTVASGNFYNDSNTITPSGALPSRNYAGDFAVPLTVTSGVAADGSGAKHRRFGASCSTAATAGATCTTTYSWTTAFADASYTPVCWGEGPSGSPILTLSATQVAASVTIQVQAATAVVSSFAGVYCIATHD